MTKLSDTGESVRHEVMAEAAIAIHALSADNKEESLRLLSQALFQSKHHVDKDDFDPQNDEGCSNS